MKLALDGDSLLYMSFFFFCRYCQLCQNFWESFFRGPENVIRWITINLSPGFCGQNSTWLSLIWEKRFIAVAFWQSAPMPGNAPLSRYCFSCLRWVCSSMLQCLRTGTLWPCITGKLNCSLMPRCHRVQSAIIFSQTQQLDAGTANQGRQWAG